MTNEDTAAAGQAKQGAGGTAEGGLSRAMILLFAVVFDLLV